MTPLIPGPDPGACPRCGRWRKAGMIHVCKPPDLPEIPRGVQTQLTKEAVKGQREQAQGMLDMVLTCTPIEDWPPSVLGHLKPERTE